LAEGSIAIIRRIGIWLSLASLSLAAAMTAGAQEQSSSGGDRKDPAVEIIATHGGWTVQCEDMGGQSARMCVMAQRTRNDKNHSATLTLVFVKTKPGGAVNQMRIAVPIGVFLPTGVTVEIDGKPTDRLQFRRCLPQVCVAFAEATAELLDKFRNGGSASFNYYEAPGLGLPSAMPLAGFAEALAELEKL